MFLLKDLILFRVLNWGIGFPFMDHPPHLLNTDDDNNCCYDNFDQNIGNFDDNYDKKY